MIKNLKTRKQFSKIYKIIFQKLKNKSSKKIKNLKKVLQELEKDFLKVKQKFLKSDRNIFKQNKKPRTKKQKK